jgi:8-hydroxy-5-deazaflavin:NADPH oxidoreductase
MSIAIIGAGNVGMALGKALTARGEHVFFGVPDPAKYSEAVRRLGPSVRLGTTDEAIDSADIVILAVPYSAAVEIARSRDEWRNRILVDATNPLVAGLAGLSLGTTTSGAECIARAAAGARVVKAFNTTGAENMADSHYANGQVFMPVCTDDAEARERVIALATLIGFDAADLGDLSAARYLEPLAMTWIHMAFRMGYGRNFAFSIMRRDRSTT